MAELNPNSILVTTRIFCEETAECTDYDSQLIPLINAALMNLHEFGVGPKTLFKITGDSETWDEFFEGQKELEAAITYVGIKCKTVFDPSASATVTEAYERNLKELEWRMIDELENTAYEEDWR